MRDPPSFLFKEEGEDSILEGKPCLESTQSPKCRELTAALLTSQHMSVNTAISGALERGSCDMNYSLTLQESEQVREQV